MQPPTCLLVMEENGICMLMIFKKVVVAGVMILAMAVVVMVVVMEAVCGSGCNGGTSGGGEASG